MANSRGSRTLNNSKRQALEAELRRVKVWCVSAPARTADSLGGVQGRLGTAGRRLCGRGAAGAEGAACGAGKIGLH